MNYPVCLQRGSSFFKLFFAVFLTAQSLQRSRGTWMQLRYLWAMLAVTCDLNRLECVGETLRVALNSIATIAPKWLQDWVPLE